MARAALPGMPAAGPAEEHGLEIAELQTQALREPVSGRSYSVVKIQTRSGLVGYGECAGASIADLARVKALVVGIQATAYEVARRRLAGLPGLQAAVNMALLDLLGKSRRVPIYQVLGGPTRNKVRAMTALGGAGDAGLLASLKAARAAGFRAFLVPLPGVSSPNQGQAFVQATVRRLEALRSAGGEDVDFVLDGSAALSPGDAATLSAALERFHLLWFDEPCRISNLGVIRKLAAERVTPLGFGRDLHDGGAFQDLLREEAADVLRPAVSLNGISPIRKVAALAETYYIVLAPYHDGGPIATAAALHLAASIPNFYLQQIPFPEAEKDRRMRAELTARSVEMVKDGFAELPTGPGLGIAVNEEAWEKYKQ